MELDVSETIIGGTLLAEKSVQDSNHWTGAVWEGLFQGNSKPSTNTNKEENEVENIFFCLYNRICISRLQRIYIVLAYFLLEVTIH